MTAPNEREPQDNASHPPAEATHENADNKPDTEVAPPVEGEDELTRVSRELEETRSRADEHFANWQRAAADLINFRRRVEQEREELGKYAKQDVLMDLLPVVDDWERAFASLPAEMARFTWVQGVVQIYQKLLWTLGRHGITPIDALDHPFDPRVHEAVMREEDVDPAEQTHVVAELQRGYKLHDRVLRPALVKVGRTPAQTPESTDEAEAGGPAQNQKGDGDADKP